MSAKQEFLTLVEEAISTSSFIKITFSKPLEDNPFYKTTISTVLGKSKFYKQEQFTKTQNFTTKLSSSDDLLNSIKTSLADYLFSDLSTTHHVISLKSTTKGRSTLTHAKKSSKDQNTNPTQHNKDKNYLIDARLPFLYDLDLTTAQGEVKSNMYHKYRQINRYIEIIAHHTPFSDNKNPTIVDMGCGKAYLTFALHHYLTSHGVGAIIKGYDLKEDVIKKVTSIAKKYDMKNLAFACQDIDEVSLDQIDMLIALHACDIATDLAIAKGVKSNAKYIVLSPCCHKQIRKEMSIKDEITRYGIYEERMAEMITDTIRTLLLNHYGYKTQVIEYISAEHTAKNTMIIASKIYQSDPKALSKIKDLKAKFGITQHYLESILN
jgi:SAM-dependent methyltransferase